MKLILLILHYDYKASANWELLNNFEQFTLPDRHTEYLMLPEQTEKGNKKVSIH